MLKETKIDLKYFVFVTPEKVKFMSNLASQNKFVR